jgi:PAS domain S-box-containing protein
LNRRVSPDRWTDATIVEQRLQLALDAGQLGTWTWSIAAGRTVWDERLEELHGLEPGGFGGTFEDWVESLHPDDRAECLARVEAALAAPGPYVLLHRTTWRDGSVHHIECRGTVLVDVDGTPTGTTGIAFDVTDRQDRDAALTLELAREREVVQTLQCVLLPVDLPTVAGARVAARYLAAEANVDVGGDWYAILPLSDHELGIAIGDVAGHGLGAVADMASARFSLRALGLVGASPAEVLVRLNHVVEVFDTDTIVTALYGVLDTQARTWTYASAGHYPAVLRSAEKRTCLLDEKCDPPLGIATTMHEHRVDLEPGAMLVLYTDGLVERRGESIDTGFERLRRACEVGPAEPHELCEFLLATVRAEPTDDDIAIVAVAVD